MRPWIVTAFCFFLYSLQLSAQWQIEKNSENHWLFGADFVNGTTGWAVGDSGIIIKTTDAGLNWTSQNSGTFETFNAVDFINALTGWAVGDNEGRIIKTTDGGASWVLQDSGRILTGIQFLNADTGWAVGANGLVLSTTDGGGTWNQVIIPDLSSYLTTIFFSDANTGWMGGDFPGTVLNTTDGGTTWSYVTNGIDPNEDIEDIFFVNQQTGWVTGYNFPDTVGIGVIKKTTDGGATWVPQTSGSSEFLLALGFVDQNTGWAIGGNGTILGTTDGGASWGSETSGTTDELDKIVVRGGTAAWVVGGKILRKNLGGLSEQVFLNVNSRWNMVSLPVNKGDRSRSSVFPTSNSSLYAFVPGSGYVTAETLNVGTGYWLKFPSSQTVIITGSAIDSVTINCPKNWSIIGGITSNVLVSNIIQNPPNSIATLFGYSNGYYPDTTFIAPGVGYWVKCKNACTLTFKASVNNIPKQFLTDVSQLTFEELPPGDPNETEFPAHVQSIPLPKEFAIHQNYPNPFNPSTVIRYDLPEASYVRVSVHNILGQEIAVLVNGIVDAGVQTVEWMVGNNSQASSGIYFYRINATSLATGKEFIETNKMVLIK